MWKFLRSMIVIWTGALASVCAAFRPPKPAPTITIRGRDWLVIVGTSSTYIRFNPMADGARSSSLESAPARRSWANWLLPSASDLIYIGIFCVLIFTALAVKLLGDAGIGWHIRTGQQMLAEYSIPRTDPFSSTMGGKPWFAWEWLYDAAVGVLANIAGLNAVVWFTAAVIAVCVRVDVPAAGAARDEFYLRAVAGDVGHVGVDHSFSGAPACGELDVDAGILLGARLDRAQLFQGYRTASQVVGLAVADAGVGECAWRLRAGIRAARDFLVWRDLDLAPHPGCGHQRCVAKDRSGQACRRSDSRGFGVGCLRASSIRTDGSCMATSIRI